MPSGARGMVSAPAFDSQNGFCRNASEESKTADKTVIPAKISPKGYKIAQKMKICAIREDVENQARNLCSMHIMFA
jgi:hypothetical protein